MSIDDQLRDALRDDAGTASPPPDGWDHVRARADAHTRRRRAIRYPVAGLVAAAAIAAIVVGIAALRTTSESEPPNIATPSGAGMPEEIVALVDQRLVVLDSETGAEIRTLTERASGALSADSEFVYFMRRDDRDCDPPTYEIVRVPVTGGQPEHVSFGVSPRVSPDGRWLAYVSNGFESPPASLSSSARCLAASQLAVRDLSTDQERRLFVPGNDRDRAIPSPLGWSADSQTLLFEIYRGGDVDEERRLLDPDAEEGGLDDSNSSPVVAPDGTLNAFGLSYDGELLVSRSTPNGREIALSNPATGDVTRSIVGVAENVNVYDAALDPSGKHLIFLAGDPLDFAPIQRITIGENGPVTLSTSAFGAAWVPTGSRTPVSTTTPETTPESTPTAPTATVPAATFPETIVAVDADGRLIVMASDDATRRSELLAPPTDGSQYESVSVGPEGEIAVSRITPSDSYCATFETAEIQLVNRETSRVETVGQGRYPAISPDGRRLAWVGVADCVTVLRVRDLATGAESVLTSPPSTDGGPDPQLSGPMTWAPDSQHLMVPMNVEPLRDWWYIDADASDGTLSGAVIKQRGEQGGPFAVAFEPGAELAAVIANNDGSDLRLALLDPQTGDEDHSANTLDLPDDIGVFELQSDSPGERFLLLAGGGDEKTLYRLDSTNGLVAITTGIRSADW